MKKIFIALPSLLAAAALLLAPSRSSAADPNILITWRSSSLAPYDFSGKLLPTANSPIIASVEVLLDNGTLADLSGESIHWYANNTPIGNGKGMQTNVFAAPALPGGIIDLRVELPDFAVGGFIADTIQIPVASPTAVIEPPFPGFVFSGSPIRLKAHAYYFNLPDTSNLTFAWEVNGSPPQAANDPEILNISIDPKTTGDVPLNIQLNVRNPDVLYESAQSTMALTYKK